VVRKRGILGRERPPVVKKGLRALMLRLEQISGGVHGRESVVSKSQERVHRGKGLAKDSERGK